MTGQGSAGHSEGGQFGFAHHTHTHRRNEPRTPTVPSSLICQSISQCPGLSPSLTFPVLRRPIQYAGRYFSPPTTATSHAPPTIPACPRTLSTDSGPCAVLCCAALRCCCISQYTMRPAPGSGRRVALTRPGTLGHWRGREKNKNCGQCCSCQD
jgi:hypothetical protein